MEKDIYFKLYQKLKAIQPTDSYAWDKCLSTALYLFDKEENSEILTWCWEVILRQKNVKLKDHPTPTTYAAWSWIRNLMVLIMRYKGKSFEK